MQKKLEQLIKQISLKAFAVGLLFIICLLVFAYIADENVLENNNSFDAKVMAFISSHRTATLIHIMQVITFFGSTQFLFPAYFILSGYLIWKKNTTYATDIIIIAISSTAVMFVLKQFFKRHRPLLPVGETLGNYSFPSGHSLSSFIFCSILAYLIWMSSIKIIWKYVAAFLLLLFSFTIGLSRIVLNLHFATDVIAGFCLGIIWVLLSFWIMKKIRKKISTKAGVQ
jgi:membrane-associated phospholipid phosphatase